MRTLGIDPGTATTGFGVIDENDNKLSLVDYGCIKTSPKNTASDRLKSISSELKKIIDKFKPENVAVEQLFFAANSKTAIKVGEARGVILLTAAQAGVKISEYTPLQVKQALTGYGRADKKQIQYMVKNLLKCKEIPKPDDAADALAIAICHINSRKLKELR
ncbi:MAG: crossover junction endodeoxyribonuclease RuvC [Candidatus Saganbacteria bacterium]|nr:crossover junction endodeoxyribonuclease RuvC [Candidatus Saganbacteria bacterium]